MEEIKNNQQQLEQNNNEEIIKTNNDKIEEVKINQLTENKADNLTDQQQQIINKLNDPNIQKSQDQKITEVIVIQQQQPSSQNQNTIYIKPVQSNEKNTFILQCQELKKENYNLLREWDANRQYYLKVHQTFLEKFIGCIDQLLIQSQNYLLNINEFFIQKARQEAQFASYPLPKMQDYFLKNTQGQTIYKDLSKGLTILEDANVSQTQKVAEFASLINENIVQKLINPQIDQHNQLFNQARHNLQVLKKTLSSCQNDTGKKSANLSQTYLAYIQQKNFQNIDKDVYKKHVSFLRRADELKDTQLILARHTIKFWKSAIEMELQRSKVIVQAVKLYKEGYEKTYLQAENKDNLYQVISFQEVSQEEIEKIYSYKHFLAEEEITYIKQQLKKEGEELQLKDIYLFLESFVIQQYNLNKLILQQIKAQRELIQNQFRNSTFIVTVDGFLLCYDQIENEQTYRKANVTIKLKQVKIIKIEKLIIDLQVKQNLLLNMLTPAERHRFQFKTQQDLDDFEKLVTKF